MVDELAEPVSAVANCHVPGLYSFVFSEDLRVFAADNWTPLAGNLFAEAVGFHDHHRAVQLKVIKGKIVNIVPNMTMGERHPDGYKAWEWDSRLRGGKGRFAPKGSEKRWVGDKWTFTTLTPDSLAQFMPGNVVHTVYQASKCVVWSVREVGQSSGEKTTTWSQVDLSKWHLQKGMYAPIPETVMSRLWQTFK